MIAGTSMGTTYCGPAPAPGDWLARWNLDPVLLVALAMALALIALRLSGRERAFGVAAVLLLIVIFVSPLCALSSALFAARVVHHVLLIAVAAPLLALAFPARRAARLVVPFAIATVTLWTWHLPIAYDAALANVPLYWVMQLTLLGSGVLFWRAVLASGRSPVDQLVFVVAAFAQMGLLGAILTFASTPLYAAHGIAPLAWGLTPIQDQTLGGLIMWAPAGIPYAVAAVLIARRGWARLNRVVA